MKASEITSMIDHTVLSPASPVSAFRDACAFAKKHGCASVCISPFFVKECAALLAGSGVKTCTVIGFPSGLHTTEAKVAEAKIAIADGADELDMVVNVPKVKEHDWDFVRSDIGAVTDVVHTNGRKIKVIFENCYLNDDEKIKLCEICSELGCDWVKTSTGFGSGGATIEDLKLMKSHIGPKVQVKAAGGIRTLAQFMAAKEAGVTRVGCSRTAAVLDEAAALAN